MKKAEKIMILVLKRSVSSSDNQLQILLNKPVRTLSLLLPSFLLLSQ